MQEQGGAVVRLRKITILSGEAKPLAKGDSRGFAYKCRWTVAGTVEHWGHVHERTNQYVAEFTVEPIKNYWKITQMKILDEQRVNFETRLRGL